MSTASKQSESITENIFRDFYGINTFIEKSAIPSEYGFISKNGTTLEGYPDFFLDNESDYSIVVEAKATNHNKAKSEVQFYMKNNNITKDIIGVAISGQKKDKLKVTYYMRLFGNDNVIELDIDNNLLSLNNIKKFIKKQKRKK